MSEWHVSFTIPIGLLLRVAAVYLAFGLVLVFPLDRVLWAMFCRRGYRRSYWQHVASRTPKWYPSAIVKWPAACFVVSRAAWKWVP